MNAIFSVLLQLSAWDWAVADEPAPAVDANAAVTSAASASTNPPLLFIHCPPWWVVPRLDVEPHNLLRGRHLLLARHVAGSVSPAS